VQAIKILSSADKMSLIYSEVTYKIVGPNLLLLNHIS
jgi:hypothetical protein